MKAAFEIKPEEPIATDTHVLFEIAHYGISVIWFKKDPLTIDGVAIYNFQDDAPDSNIIQMIREIVFAHTGASNENVHVFYNFKESMLIPDVLMHDHTYSAQLNLLYGLSPGAAPCYEEVMIDSRTGRQDKMFCAYRIPKGISEFIETVSASKARHSTSAQVKSGVNRALYCTFFHNTVKVFLYGNKQLLFVQQYTYKTPPDVVYHLLNTCEKYQVNAYEVNLYIDGMIDNESSLYQEIFKYFLHVHFNVIADEIYLAGGIKEHPLHFISHLTELAKCV